MFDRIFPPQLDNGFRGPRLAIWLFVPIVLMELTMGMNSLFNTRTVAMLADGIPLDRYGGGGADAVVAIFAIAALFRILLALQGIVVLIRYRAMIPFLYLQLLVLHLGSKALLALHPIARSGVDTANLGSAFVYVLIAMLVAGFLLSLNARTDPAAQIRAQAGR